MRYLPLLLALVSPVSMSSEPVGRPVLVPCPAMGAVAQWWVTNPEEIDILKNFLSTGDVAAFIEGMAAIDPLSGVEARRYIKTCLVKT